MTHWVVHPLRGWLAFLSLTNLGTGLRCLWEEGFMQQRIFTELKTSDGLPGCPEMERTFGFWSVFNAILFLHCSIFLEEPPIFSMTVFSLTVYLAYFANEAFVHHSISRGGAALFPILLSALTMLWLAVAYKFIWPSSRKEDDDNENEHLAERLSTQQPRLKRKTKFS
ncbi:uncharacterized protein LOC8025126 [Ixodes scapularis]|uniref:uncharacterized protein LOC8025126 n=1 Tax=Ixodes scapularis TaxID=6945 RepID=UPI001A9FF851|nr:uncharacterized protein LOC8025126 [Ixodes scapularis]